MKEAAWWDLINHVEEALQRGDALAAEAHSQVLWDACQREALPASPDVVAALARRATDIFSGASQQLHRTDEAQAALGLAVRAAHAYPRG